MKGDKRERFSFNRVCGVALLSLVLLLVAFHTGPSETEPRTIGQHDANDKGGSSRSVAIDDDFQLAFRESLGFFNDIPAHEWQQMKNITRHSRPYQHRWSGNVANDAKGVQRYYAGNWDPDFSCRFENSIGQAQSDGHKWVCDPQRLVNKKDCLIYSIGSNGNFAFEMDMQQHLPNCEIHVFDPTDYSQKMQTSGLNGSNYHAWGLKSSYGKPMAMSKKLKGLDFVSLPESVARLGHDDRKIDIFKIDCEGCEWSAHKDLLDQNIQQILVEVHGVNDGTDQFFSDLRDGGYAIFHKEPNLFTGGNCIEFAFLKLAKEYFE